MSKLQLAIGLALSAAALSATAASRDYIAVVGSSTVFPFTTVVAEQFGKTSKFKTPKIESTGTGGGFKLFCAGVGVEHPDMTNASRAIKDSEKETCAKNGVTEVVEVKIGYDGLSVANSKKSKQFDLTRRDLFLALAKDVPDPKGGSTLVPNPYKTWKQVNASLPDAPIEVLGPPPTSGTRDSFVELGMEPGCETFDFIKAMKKSDEKAFKAVCLTVREDGKYVEAGENDNLIVQKLDSNPNALGIFGYSFLEQNADKLQGSKVEGVAPNFETISDGSYTIARPLFFYVKKQHVGSVPGIAEFLAEFTSEKAWGDDGYLSDKGLIPLPKAERSKVGADVKALKTLGK